MRHGGGVFADETMSQIKDLALANARAQGTGIVMITGNIRVRNIPSQNRRRAQDSNQSAFPLGIIKRGCFGWTCDWLTYRRAGKVGLRLMSRALYF